MRTLHVTRDLPPHTRGGLSVAVGALVSALRGAGHTPHVVSFDSYRPRARRAPEQAQVDASGTVLRLSAPSALGDAHAFARAAAPALVHVHDAMLWDFSRQVARALDVPLALHVHVLHAALDELRGARAATFSRQAQQRAFAEADAVIAPSRTVRDALRAQQPRLAERLHICPSGVELPAPRPAPRRTGPALYMGRFADVKGTLDWACALRRIYARRPDARAIFAGGVPDRASAQRRWVARLSAQAAPPGEGSLAFPGWLPPEGRDTAYAGAGLLVVPSWYETLGLSALEGMARGLPIVATTGGALGELLRDGHSALLCAPRDVGGLAHNVLRLLRDPALAARLGAAARRDAQGYAWAQVLPRYLGLYDALTSSA